MVVSALFKVYMVDAKNAATESIYGHCNKKTHILYVEYTVHLFESMERNVLKVTSFLAEVLCTPLLPAVEFDSP